MLNKDVYVYIGLDREGNVVDVCRGDQSTPFTQYTGGIDEATHPRIGKGAFDMRILPTVAAVASMVSGSDTSPAASGSNAAAPAESASGSNMAPARPGGNPGPAGPGGNPAPAGPGTDPCIVILPNGQAINIC